MRAFLQTTRVFGNSTTGFRKSTRDFSIIILHRLLTGSRDVGSVDDEALVDRQQVLAFDDEFGHWGFSCLIFPTPRLPPTSVSRSRNWSAISEGLQSEFGEAFLAGGLVGHVMDKVVLVAGDAEEVRELVDHEPDRGILADALGVYVFMVPHLAAGIGDRQRNAARVAGAGVDDHQRVAEAAAMGAFCFRHE